MQLTEKEQKRAAEWASCRLTSFVRSTCTVEDEAVLERVIPLSSASGFPSLAESSVQCSDGCILASVGYTFCVSTSPSGFITANSRSH